MSKVSEMLARVRELAAAATPEPWRSSQHTFGDPGDGPTLYRIHGEFQTVAFIHEVSRMADNDGELIAEYRTLAPRMADMLERAMEELERANHNNPTEYPCEDGYCPCGTINALAEGGEA